MKSIFKFLTVALAVGSLASCTDDLNLNEPVAQKDQLIATLPSIDDGIVTRVGVIPVGGQGNYVWSADDEVNIYAQKSLVYEQYKLVEGEEGKEVAAFEKKPTTAQLDVDDTKYAVTQPSESGVIYGVSSLDGKALLTATIPASFDWSTLKTADNQTAFVVESPFWGPADVSGEGFKVSFKALTSFLKVDMQVIPENTKALVLTTHEDFQIGDIVYTGGADEALAGTMNAILDENNPQGLKADPKLVSSDTIRVNLDIPAGGEEKVLYIPVPAGNYKKLYLLAVTDDNKLPFTYNAAEIVREWDDVDFQLGRAKTIAVTDLKDLTYIKSPLELSKAIASIVEQSGNHTVRVKAAPVVDGADNTIYLATNFDGQTSVEITFEYAGTSGGGSETPSTSEAPAVSEAPVSIAVSETPVSEAPAGSQTHGTAGGSESPVASEAPVVSEAPVQPGRTRSGETVELPASWGGKLYIVEAPVVKSYFSAGFNTNLKATAESVSGAKERTVRLNFTGKTYDQDLAIYLPTSDVVLNNQSEDGFAAATSSAANELGKFKGTIEIVAANTNHVSAYDYTELNNKEAGIILKGGNQYAKVNVLKGCQSAVYVYGDDTEVLVLNIASTQPAGIRLTDALAGEINFTGNILDNHQGIFTTGAAAIKKVTGCNGTGYVYPFWTGKAISDYAVKNGYEGKDVMDADWRIESGAIYTAAQLQAAGLDASLNEATTASKWTSGSPVTSYKITKKVSKIQLGGDRYPWLGGQIGKLNADDNVAPYASDRSLSSYKFKAAQITKAVTIDGNSVELTNMELSYNDPYVKDPHRCCTSCGDYYVKVDQDLGLFRNILTTGAVEIDNIYLNNVELEAPDQYIPNVGSIVGRIESANLTMKNNKTKNIEIWVKGNDVGGQVGDAWANGNVDVNGAEVGDGYTETKVLKNYVKTTGDNAGGVFGNLNGQGTVKIAGASVGLAEVSAFKGSNAGGIAGELEFKTGGGSVNFSTAEMRYLTISGITSQIDNGKVNVTLLQATENPKSATSQAGYGKSGDNVGGFIGNLVATATEDRVVWTEQKGQNFEAWGTFKSTDKVLAEGRNAGGLIGRSYLPETSTNDRHNVVAISSATDKQKNTTVTLKNLEATNGNAGGLIGYVYKGDAVIGGGSQAKDKYSEVNATADLISTASGGAGLVGENSDAVDVSGITRVKYDGSYKEAKVTATVKDFANTWTKAQFESGYAYGGSSQMSKKLGGTFAAILGHGNNEFFIYDKAVTASPKPIADAKKLALFFDVNPDGINTHSIETDKFWGDQNGFVGYMTNTGSYYLNGSIPQGDQGFNYRKPYSAK